MKKAWIILACASLLACNKQQFEYPETAKTDTVDTYFGKSVADPYRWLEDPSLP